MRGSHSHEHLFLNKSKPAATLCQLLKAVDQHFNGLRLGSPGCRISAFHPWPATCHESAHIIKAKRAPEGL